MQSVSLRNHLALAALRTGNGNGHLLSQLIHALYMAWYLREAGFGTADHPLFRDAAEALERSATRATTTDVWKVSPDDAAVLERLLALHDEQLASTPVGVMHGAQKRIARFARSDRRVPWQETGP
ncbi:hypothetical protein [Paraburkholderia graminis]|uniref:hypothetical protein n=1 Tax=Paraburkholderia graminis TaxID=60548 RepID=UPI00040D42FC